MSIISIFLKKISQHMFVNVQWHGLKPKQYHWSTKNQILTSMFFFRSGSNGSDHRIIPKNTYSDHLNI